MLLVPSDKPFDYRQPPRLSLGLAALLLILFVWLAPQEQAQMQNLNTQYQQQLLSLEWPLYPTHVLQHQQTQTLEQLQSAYMQRDYLPLMQQMGFDRSFVKNLQSSGDNYFEPQQYQHWQDARQQFDTERDQLTSQVLGLDTQRFRPITYFSYAFVDLSLNTVLASTLLLLLVGMIVEWALGSGALLSAWLLGSVVTAIVYHLSHLHSVTPLLGSTGAISGVLGVAFAYFRPTGSLTVTGGKLQLSGWIFLALFVLVTGIHFSLNNFSDKSLIIAHCASFVSGIIISLVYKRWFLLKSIDISTESIAENENENTSDERYQTELNQVLQHMANLNFSDAKNLCEELILKYPQDKRVQECLYHLCKFNPAALEFEDLACSLFNLPNQTSSNHLILRIYNDYKKRSQSFVALDTDTCLQLAMRFARINAFKEAEEIFKRALDSKKSSLLFKKAALTLQQQFSAQQQDQRAHFYGQIASQYQE